MAVLLSTDAEAMAAWREALLALEPALDIRLFPEAGDPAGIEAAVVWSAHDMAELRRYPKLRLIVSMGAGVDHLRRAREGRPLLNLVDVSTGYQAPDRNGTGWPGAGRRHRLQADRQDTAPAADSRLSRPCGPRRARARRWPPRPQASRGCGSPPRS